MCIFRDDHLVPCEEHGIKLAAMCSVGYAALAAEVQALREVARAASEICNGMKIIEYEGMPHGHTIARFNRLLKALAQVREEEGK